MKRNAPKKILKFSNYPFTFLLLLFFLLGAVDVVLFFQILCMAVIIFCLILKCWFLILKFSHLPHIHNISQLKLKFKILWQEIHVIFGVVVLLKKQLITFINLYALIHVYTFGKHYIDLF